MASNKPKYDVLASIDIGSHTVRMKIAEVSSQGKIHTLEVLRKPITLGKDSFNTGRIMLNHVDHTCQILKGFKKKMKEYGVSRYRVVATSAIREAENCDYVLEHIRRITGFNVTIISDSEERFYTYKAIGDRMKDFVRLRREGALIVDIGAGGVEVTYYKDNMLKFTRYIKTGSLRLREILSDLERRTLDFPRLLEEFLECETNTFDLLFKNTEIPHFIGIGGEMPVILDICGMDSQSLGLIPKDLFLSKYDEIKFKTIEQLVSDYDMSIESAQTLLPSIMVFNRFMRYTTAENIISPMVSLRDGLICDMVDKKQKLGTGQLFHEDILSCARNLGERYFYEAAHATRVEKLAMQMFDGLKKLHNLTNRDRMLLQVAAILHDVGKYIDLKEHHKLSYNIILSSDIFGLSDSDVEIIANVAFYHGRYDPSSSRTHYGNLQYRDRMVVSKLTAMLKLADSLDKSHKQKISDIHLILDDTTLTVKTNTVDDILLEHWEFENKSPFFEEVFGLKPILQNKRM